MKPEKCSRYKRHEINTKLDSNTIIRGTKGLTQHEIFHICGKQRLTPVTPSGVGRKRDSNISVHLYSSDEIMELLLRTYKYKNIKFIIEYYNKLNKALDSEIINYEELYID